MLLSTWSNILHFVAENSEINFSLPHGAMAVRSDELVMVDTLILADADPGEIEASLEYLAATADHYEASIFGPDVH